MIDPKRRVVDRGFPRRTRCIFLLSGIDGGTKERIADRAYEPDGILRKRTLAGALLENPTDAARQAIDIATGNFVRATNGSELKVSAQTVCIHSDTPGSAAIARAVNEALKKAGVAVQGLSKGLE